MPGGLRRVRVELVAGDYLDPVDLPIDRAVFVLFAHFVPMVTGEFQYRERPRQYSEYQADRH